MTRLQSGRIRTGVVIALVVTALSLLAPASAQSATARATPAGATPRTAITAPRTVTLAWDGSDRHRRMTRSVTVPGAGQLKLTCRPDDTRIALTTNSPAAETQMWMAKHETKHDEEVVAVKTVRLYRYANADSPAGGTGRTGHEGLNQQSPVEDRQSGYIDGLISQRPGRNQPALHAALRPATSFELTWWWTGFRQPRAQQQCRMRLTLQTAATSYGLSWHGDDDAGSGSDTHTVAIPGLGTLGVTCETGRDGDQELSLAPVDTDGWSGAYVETVTGEGAVDDHVDTDDYTLDPTTGLIGPIPLPRNGMLRVFFSVGLVRANLIVSSYIVSNNDQNPGRNLCEIAAAPF